MEANNQNRTIALAALLQCVEGVLQVAHHGHVDNALLGTCLNSILTEEASSIEAIYGGIDHLRIGLKSLMYQLGTGGLTPDGKPKNIEATRYAVNLLYLEKKLAADSAIFQLLINELEQTQRQLNYFEITHPTLQARLADIYTNTISKLGPRIMIKGEQSHLANPDNAIKIRALLLAGIRAALLWRQAGGNRWRLIFSRGAMQKEAQRLLQQY